MFTPPALTVFAPPSQVSLCPQCLHHQVRDYFPSVYTTGPSVYTTGGVLFVTVFAPQSKASSGPSTPVLPNDPDSLVVQLFTETSWNQTHHLKPQLFAPANATGKRNGRKS